jgi:Tfp pilus assembly protein PilV
MKSKIINRMVRFSLNPRPSPLTSGFGLAEVVVAAAIIAVGISGILAAYAAYERAAGEQTNSVQAMLLAEEGVEAVIVMRDTSWTNTVGSTTLSVGTPYFLKWSGGTWNISSIATETDNVYYRTVTFGSVNRGANDEITTSGGTLDSNTRLATVAVSWYWHSATSTVSLSRYVSNLFNN